MSEADAAEWVQFFLRWHSTMIRMALEFGASHPDAEDAASAVTECVQRSWTHWQAADDKKSYLRTAIRHELYRSGRKHVARQARELRWTGDSPSSTHDSIADGELDGVRQALAIATPRQREVLAWLILAQQAGWDVKDIAARLGVHPSTIRRHRQNARETLAPFLIGNGHELRRWLRAAERIHEDFHRGTANPFGPRPDILEAWEMTREWELDPGRGTKVVQLDRDELRQRRAQSPVPGRSPILAELFDLAERNDLLAVVLDTDSIVLYRGGHPDALAAADRLGYQEAAAWNLYNAGVNAAGLAPILGRPATVNRFEHTFRDQARLCCLAIPVRTPAGEHITLNLTAATEALTSVPRAIHRQLHTIAQHLHRQLWTPPKEDRS